jgi:outer membrane protein TolC
MIRCPLAARIAAWLCLGAACAAQAAPPAGAPALPVSSASGALSSSLPAGAGALPALQDLPTPTLPREALLRALLAQAPSLAEAGALQNAAGAQGDALRAGSQEFTAQAQLQQRRVDEPPDNGNYAEWQLLLSRPLRLPSQASADSRLAGALQQSARSAAVAARRELLAQVLQAWFDTQLAQAESRLAAAQSQALDAQTRALRKRLARGDVSQLELDQLLAEQSRAAAAALLAQGRLDSQRAALQARWPLLAADQQLRGDPASAADLSAPTLADAQLRRKVLQASDALALARGAVDQARARADQASAQRTPQPTVGAYLGSDRGGRERIVGLQFQMPFGGPARQAHERAALAELDAAQWRLRDTEARVLEQAERLRLQARAQADAAQALDKASQAQAQAAARMLRAWQLGEAGVADWLLARRNALDVERQALQARFDAARSAALLRLQAGLLSVAQPPAGTASTPAAASPAG